MHRSEKFNGIKHLGPELQVYFPGKSLQNQALAKVTETAL
jgi:hypothetical protein